MPYYWIEEQLKQDGIRITRQTLSKRGIKLGELLESIADLLKQEILSGSRLFVDETSIKLQSSAKKGKCKTARIWAYLGGKGRTPPLVGYECTETREQKYFLENCEKFTGVFHSDAYSAYENFSSREGIYWQVCWAKILVRHKVLVALELRQFRKWTNSLLWKKGMGLRIFWKETCHA